MSGSHVSELLSVEISSYVKRVQILKADHEACRYSLEDFGDKDLDTADLRGLTKDFYLSRDRYARTTVESQVTQYQFKQDPVTVTNHLL